MFLSKKAHVATSLETDSGFHAGDIGRRVPRKVLNLSQTTGVAEEPRLGFRAGRGL